MPLRPLPNAQPQRRPSPLWTAAALLAASLALWTAPAAARGFEILPPPFTQSEPGEAVLFDTESGPVAFVLIGPSGEGHEGAYFSGCPVPTTWPLTPEALRDPATLGAPFVRYWYDADGMILRSRSADGRVAVSEPHHCIGAIGACRSAHEAAWDGAGGGAQSWSTEMTSEYDGRILRWRERVTAESGRRGGWVEAEGWWEILPNAWFGDGESVTRWPDGSETRAWWRRQAGPAPIAELCAGMS